MLLILCLIGVVGVLILMRQPRGRSGLLRNIIGAPLVIASIVLGYPLSKVEGRKDGIAIGRSEGNGYAADESILRDGDTIRLLYVEPSGIDHEFYLLIEIEGGSKRLLLIELDTEPCVGGTYLVEKNAYVYELVVRSCPGVEEKEPVKPIADRQTQLIVSGGFLY